jgi:hypothetical protein
MLLTPTTATLSAPVFLRRLYHPASLQPAHYFHVASFGAPTPLTLRLEPRDLEAREGLRDTRGRMWPGVHTLHIST